MNCTSDDESILAGRPLHDLPIMDLEAQGYTHASWTCEACGITRSRGFRLMRLRGHIRAESSISSAIERFRCKKCNLQPTAEMIAPSRQGWRRAPR
jgi:hypothetical protein